MFLWVRLVVSMLENAYTVKQMLEALDGIPPGLEEVLVAQNVGHLNLLIRKLAITKSSCGSKR